MSPVILTSSLKRGRQQPDRRKESHELTSWLGSCFSLPIYRSLSLLWGFVCSEQTETFTQHTIIPIASARQFKCEEFKQRVEIFYNLCLSSATNTETPMTSTHTIAFQWIGRITGHWRKGKKHIFAKQWYYSTDFRVRLIDLSRIEVSGAGAPRTNNSASVHLFCFLL